MKVYAVYFLDKHFNEFGFIGMFSSDTEAESAIQNRMKSHLDSRSDTNWCDRWKYTIEEAEIDLPGEENTGWQSSGWC